jgi:hypothetical protein
MDMENKSAVEGFPVPLSAQVNESKNRIKKLIISKDLYKFKSVEYFTLLFLIFI